jgi:hypothetical protein
MRTSKGALQRARVFFREKSSGERVKSARRPMRKVSVARRRPRIVRYWKCQP